MNAKQAGLRFYMEEIGSNSVLTKDEEVAVFKRLESGDETAREEIIQRNLRFVIRVARQFTGRGLPLEDLIQEGNIGLMEVVNKFDYTRGFRFSTYAAFWIRQGIQQALRKHSNMIRLPIRKFRMLGCLNEVFSTYQNEQGRNPTIPELAHEMEISVEAMDHLMKMRESVLSLDEPNDDGGSLGETIPASREYSPRRQMAYTERRTKVKSVLNYLTEKERRVVRLRFGFESGQSLSLRGTSRLVGLSQEGVRRVEQKALSKLRRPAISAKVAGLL